VERVVHDHRAQATISYDPNARPLLMGSAADVRGPVEGLVAASDLVKMSDEDAASLSLDESAEELATRWLGLGPSVVVLTSGAAGMLGLCRAGRVEAPAPRVDVADTVGAGDSATAALLDGLWRHDLLGGPARGALASVSAQALEDVVRHAARAAAITVSRPVRTRRRRPSSADRRAEGRPPPARPRTDPPSSRGT
jgi:fructokinase